MGCEVCQAKGRLISKRIVVSSILDLRFPHSYIFFVVNFSSIRSDAKLLKHFHCNYFHEKVRYLSRELFSCQSARIQKSSKWSASRTTDDQWNLFSSKSQTLVLRHFCPIYKQPFWYRLSTLINQYFYKKLSLYIQILNEIVIWIWAGKNIRNLAIVVCFNDVYILSGPKY